MTCKTGETTLGRYNMPTKHLCFHAAKCFDHTKLYTVLTLEDMSYMSGIQSLFHHIPQPPHSDIRLHNRRVYTLW